MKWPTLQFSEVFKDASGGNIKTPQTEFLEQGEIPVVDQGQNLIAGYVNDHRRICKSELPVIVFGDHTRALKYVDFPFAMGADGTKVLVPKLVAEPKYLFYALKAQEIPAAGYSRHFKFLKETTIPFPPLAEQKRIAAILDAADDLRTKRRESLAQLDALLQSTFLEMFGDPVTNPKRWETVKFNEIGKFVSGATPSKARNDFWDGPIPWVSPKDMKVDRILDSIDHISECAFAETNLKRLEARHLLIVVRGMILAHSFPTATNEVTVAINQDMKAILPSSRFNIHFLKACVDGLKREILSEVSTAGHGTKRLDVEAMRKISVLSPPLDLQKRFSDFLCEIVEQKILYRAQLTELDTLFASLQSLAFRGEL